MYKSKINNPFFFYQYIIFQMKLTDVNTEELDGRKS